MMNQMAYYFKSAPSKPQDKLILQICKPRKLILIYDIESNNPASPVSYLTLTLQTDTTPSLHNKPEQPSMHTNKSFN